MPPLSPIVILCTTNVFICPLSIDTKLCKTIWKYYLIYDMVMNHADPFTSLERWGRRWLVARRHTHGRKGRNNLRLRWLPNGAGLNQLLPLAGETLKKACSMLGPYERLPTDTKVS